MAKADPQPTPTPEPTPTPPAPPSPPAPQPKITVDFTGIFGSIIAGFIGAAITLAGAWYFSGNTPSPTPPGPGPGPGPGPRPIVKIIPTLADSTAETNGKRNDAVKPALVEIVKAGNGTHVLTFQPNGADRAIWKVVVSGGVNPEPEPNPQPDPDPKPPPAPAIPVPELLKPAVEALKPYAAPRAALSKFYADFAKVLEFSDHQQLQTTAQVRDLLTASLKDFVATGVMGSAPKIGTHIDAYLASQVPLDEGEFTADKRTKMVAAYKVIAEVLK
jgi:hypothetical protein